ncbi:hypothetical protein B0H34DRAFT_332613 [Crassisporium funariophilum]|nr:hypothetical protein B0H34DRAFT_332613 [Crassisporium funariophilum]
MSRSNGGRPEPEVIINYTDGFAYSKHKLEEALRTGGFLDKPAMKPPYHTPISSSSSGSVPSAVTNGGAKESVAVKKEDVDLLVHEFEIPRAQAERVLAENGADVSRALTALITPPSVRAVVPTPPEASSSSS